MTKRMKMVFNNSQLSHVWANQSQAMGKSGSMFFEGTEIFSYGRHYMAGKIHKVKGKTFALVNNHNYSSTTIKHLSEIQGALNGLMPYFSVSDVCDLKKAVTELDARANDSIQYQLKRSKVTSVEDYGWARESVKDAFNTASELRKLLGLKPIKCSEKDMTKVEKHLMARLDRYKQLNTPEMVAAKQAKKLKVAIQTQAKQALIDAERIVDFRSGKSIQLHNLEFEIIRVKNGVVQTSRGAAVPFDDAVKLLHAIDSGIDVIGQSCGSFQVDAIFDSLDPNDKIIKIGCHKIRLSEAKAVLCLKVA